MDDHEMNDEKNEIRYYQIDILGKISARRLTGSLTAKILAAAFFSLVCMSARPSFAAEAKALKGQSHNGVTKSEANLSSLMQLHWPVHHRLPIPPAHEVRRANATLQAQFRQQYPLDTNLAEYHFYHRLYKYYILGSNGKSHPVMRYAAMRLIVRLAPLQLDVPTTFSTIAALNHDYQINPYPLMATAGEEMIAHGRMRIDTANTLLYDLVQNTTKALKTAHFRSAEEMAREGITLAHAARQIRELRLLLPMLAKARAALPFCDAYHRARRKLEIHPHDPAANTTVGLFLACFTTDNQKANAHLLLSGNPQLIALAQARSNQNAGSADHSAAGRGRIAIADDWLKLSKDRTFRQFRDPLRLLARKTAMTALQSIDADVLAALHDDHYARAQRLLKDARRMATDLNLRGYAHQIAAWKRDQKDIAMRRAQYHTAVSAMNNGKGDARAFQTIGEYLCFVSGRWKLGLSYLRRSAVSDLKTAASADVSRPTSPKKQKLLGDMWWKISDQYTGLERYNIRLRAVYWYNLAKNKLHGADLTNIIYRVLTLKHESF